MTQYSINPVSHIETYMKFENCARHATYYKLKASPFDWFQGAPNGTDVTSASTTLASMAPLNDCVLNEIQKYETESLPSYVVTDGFDLLHW